MIIRSVGRIDRRAFFKISALWTTACALNVNPVSVQAQSRVSDGAYDAVVIGTGLGGLAFAGYMARHGFKVLLIEQHDRPGGYATTFSRDSGRFTFDVSLHQLVVAGATERILGDLAVLDKVKFVKAEKLFRLISKDLDVSCPTASAERFEQILSDRFPNQKEGIHGFMTEMLDLNKEVARFFEEGKLTLAGKLTFPIRFPRMWAARKKSLEDYLNQYVTDPGLRETLSVFCGYYGLPPSQLSGFYYMNATAEFFRHGGSYPIGGSEAVSKALADFIESKGGEILCGVTVDQILIQNGTAVGVRTSDGKAYRARAVVANCSAPRLFGQMISPDHIPSDFLQKIRSLKPSVSSFVVWLGLKKDVTATVKDSHIFLSAEQDQEKAWQHSIKCDPERANIGVCIYDHINKKYSLPGTNTLSITLICGYEPWAALERNYWKGDKKEYNAMKQLIANALIRRVERDLIPGLSQIIAVAEAGTPLTNIRYTLNTAGAIYGFEQSLENSFMNRISNRTPIKGLYLAGAWGEPGGGYTGVLISGRKTFGMLMEDWGHA
ncbi:MAG: NAD(P)/FAD-dependent oxidoreductase [Deltaproteobacteria bacterium]|nr:NAD(P)/FAD-dependent oxidoreductase [Deltaproteobacteria bacterium]